MQSFVGISRICYAKLSGIASLNFDCYVSRVLGYIRRVYY